MKRGIVRKLPEELEEYRRTGCIQSRNRLVTKYIGLVLSVVQKIHKKLPKHVEFDLIASDGFIGLLDAIEHYDPQRSDFSTYASLKIRGAVVDSLRKNSWVPRGVRSRTQEFEKVFYKLLGQTGFVPTEDEVTRELNMTKRQYLKMRRDFDSPKLLQQNDGFCLDVYSSDIASPKQIVEKKDLAQFIWQVVAKLDQRHSTIFKMRVLEGLTFREIGEHLNIFRQTAQADFEKACEKIRRQFDISDKHCL